MRNVFIHILLSTTLAACSLNAGSDWDYQETEEIPTGPGLFSDEPNGGITLYKNADEVYRDD